MKAPWRRGPSRLEKVLAKHDLTEAMGRAEAAVPVFAAQSRHVRAGQGFVAHLDHPVLGILCGWKSAGWTEVAPSLRVCRMCWDRAEELSESGAA